MKYTKDTNVRPCLSHFYSMSTSRDIQLMCINYMPKP